MRQRTPFATYQWSSDHSLLVSFGDEISLSNHRKVLAAMVALRAAPIQGLRDLHPAYASVLITFNPLQVEPDRLEREIREALASPRVLEPSNQRLVEVPVCYEGEFAPDLGDVARHHNLSPEDVVRLHSSNAYVVYFLGFVPGFPYLGGLPDSLATPRLAVPRRRVPAGSVAIGGSQTGIYPFATPGGWRIIGRTPSRLFDADREPPALLSPGDRVRFVPITASSFGES